MASLVDKPTDDQLVMLKAIYESYRRNGRWPIWRVIRRAVRPLASAEPEQVRRSFPTVGSVGNGPSYGLIHYDAQDLSDKCEMRLYVAAGLHLKEFDPLATKLVEIIQFFAQGLQDIDPEADDVVFNREKLAALKHWDPNLVPPLPELLQHEPFGFFSQTMTMPDNFGWKVTLHEQGLLPYANVSTVSEYVKKVLERVEATAQLASLRLAPISQNLEDAVPDAPYVNEDLITDLESLSSSWHLGKLISLLRELNDNYAEGRTYSCLMLCRAIIDHIPPLFGCKSFAEVVAQVGGRTDKNYLRQLKDSRFMGDDVLHSQVGKKADLVRFHDVPQRLGVNALIKLAISELDQAS